jgi:16S rRNA (cytosine967-C5)-methyltransferase
VSPARGAALAVLRRLRRENAALDESTAGLKEFEGLEARDRALAFELVTGVLRRRGSCDAVLEHAATTPRRIEPDLLDVLRLGAYQLLFLDRVPAYAVVDDAVVMAGKSRHRRGFVNAVLRRVAAEGREVLQRLGAGEDDHALSVRFSVPEWIVALLRRDLGDAAATGVLEAAGQAPERCVRVNTTVIAPVAARAALEAAGYAVAAVDGLEDALVVDGPSLESSAPFRDGLVTPQSRGSQLVAPVAVAGAEGALLDVCAAPGTKTAHLAALRPRARIVAVDVDPGRVEALERNLRRLQVARAAAGGPGVTAVCADALALPPEYAGAFDAVLVDAPCTGLGTMAARPDLRWRRRPADVARMAALQRRLLAAGAACVRPGGALTYAVCTLTGQETTAVVEAFADGAEWSFDDLGAAHPQWAHPENGAYLRTLPPRDGSSGFFVARLRRRVSQAGAR